MRADSDRYFRTTALPLAVFLYAKGQQITGVNAVNDSTKKEFTLVKTPYLEELVDKYKFGERSDPDLLVSVHLYEQARNELLDRLKGN